MKIDIRDVPTYYINLEQDSEKREAVEEMLQNAGFSSVIRFEAISMADKARAITRSHLEVLKVIKKTGVPAIVLEDDCEIESFTPVLEMPDNTDAFYLGKSAWGLGTINGNLDRYSGNWNSVEAQGDGLYRVRSMYATHAIMYTSIDYVNFCIRLCETALYTGVPHDVYLATIHGFFNVYSSELPVFSQSSEHVGTIGKIDNYIIN